MPTSDPPILTRAERIGTRVALVIRHHPRAVLTLVLVVLALAGRGAPPTAEAVVEACGVVLGAAVGP